jgi:hypothetical protein
MKELTVIFFCTWKFALTFPLAIFGMKFPFIKTLIFTNIGGVLGLLFFTYFSDIIITLWLKYIKPNVSFLNKEKPVFTKRRRKFVKIKTKYGLRGIIFLNPIILSIPVSSFLVVKYYGKKARNIFFLFFGQVAWSLLYTFFYFYLYKYVADYAIVKFLFS